MQLEYAKDPVWANANHTMIDLVIKWDQFPEEHQFTATLDDCEEHGRQIFVAAVAGEFGPVAEYIAPPDSEPGPTPASGEIPVTEA